MASTSQPFLQTNNTTQQPYDPVLRQVRNSDIAIYVCYGIISLIGCVCNSITIAVMARTPSLHTLYNYLLLNLAVVDLVASIFSITKFIIILSTYRTGISDLYANILCRLFTTIIYSSLVQSVATLSAISLERYFGIVKPLVHRNMTTKRLKYVLIFIWCVFIAGCAFGSQELRMDETTYYCFLSPHEEDWPRWKPIGGWLLLTFGCILPLVLTTAVYGRIILHLKRRSQEPNLALSSQNVEIAARKTARLIRLLISITVLFSACLLPELVYFALVFYDRKYVNAALFYKIGIPMVAIIAINPLVYTMSNSSFRGAAKRLFRPSLHAQVAPRPAQTVRTATTTHSTV